MAKFQDPTTGKVQEVSSPDLNPDLIAGQTQVSDSTPLGAGIITGSSLSNDPPISIPPAPTDTTNFAGMIAGGQSMSDFFKANAPAQQESSFEDLIGQIQGLETGTGVTAAQEKASESQKGLDLLQAQLAGLSAEAQAAPIQVEKEFEGRASVRAQEGISHARLRDIALRSLPLQGQILAQQAIATNDQRALSAAQSTFDRVFQIQQQQEDRKYEYNKEVRGMVWDYLTTSEQRQLDTIQKKDDRDYNEQQDRLDELRDWTKTAVSNGQAELATELAQIDPTSDDFEAKLAEVQAKITPQAEDLATQVIEVGGRKKLINTQTGEVISDLGTIDDDLQFIGGTKTQPAGYFNKTTGVFTPTEKQGVDDSIALDKSDLRSLEQADTAITNIENVLDLMTQVGAGTPISRVVSKGVPGTPAFDLNSSLNTVKALIGFDALQKMRDASPTGGALGQVSEREIGFLQSVAGSLDAGQTNEQFTQTLTKIKESFSTLTFMIEAGGEGYTESEIQDFLREQGKL